MNLILYTTSGVFDEREISEIDISPDSEEATIELLIDIFEVGSDSIAKLSKIILNTIGFSIKMAEGCDEEDPYISIVVKLKSIWKHV